jgi:hypothetical protein
MFSELLKVLQNAQKLYIPNDGNTRVRARRP